MNTTDLARFFIRFNALCFLFWAIVDGFELPGYIFNAARDHSFADFDTTAKLALYAFVGQLAAQLLAAVFLFGYTHEIISLLTVGKWKKEPTLQATPNDR